ncbi:YqaA family protein [Pseudooceanicola sp. C21-150M6]|uniref:YqaA family protein n=1 Tax=Pseudooceanicola sp. C21-150M6 TaxID=3434355 RepID=UPI003D7F1F76
MIRKLYEWTLRMADHHNALWVLAAISFAEASFFPIPPDLLMIPMIVARPSRAFLIATVCTAASVLGGLAGYMIGALAFDTIGAPILNAFGKADAMAEFNATFVDAGFWAVLGAGITPFPFKVITIMAGWTGMPVVTFIVTSIVARALRFFIVAGLLWYFGESVRHFIEKRLGLVFTIFFLVLVGGFVAIRFL